MSQSLTFKDFLAIITEDVQQDIAKIQSDISMVDTQIIQRTTPLNARKMALQKLLALKQRQAQAEIKKAGPQAQQNNQQGNQQGQAASTNQTTTPGSTGSATPGSAPNSNVTR